MSALEEKIAGLAVLYSLSAFGGYTLYFLKNGIHCGRVSCSGVLRRLDIPPLVGDIQIGMLWLGFLATNALRPVVSRIDKDWPTYIRNFAQCVILMRSGLGLNISNLRELKGSVVLLTLVPLLSEWVTVGVTIKFALELPWDLALASAFMLSAVSPAIVIPICLKLKEREEGNGKNIQEILIGVTSIDSIFAMVSTSHAAFGITAGIALASLKGAPNWFGSTTVTAGIIALIIVIGGLAVGFASGFGLCILRKVHWAVYLAVLSALALLYAFVTMFYSLSGLSYIAIILMCIISIKSRPDNDVKKIGKVMDGVWRIAEVALFGLTGAALDLQSINPTTAGYAILVVTVGELIKVPMSFLSTATANFDWKERTYVTLCRLSKATVQASLGGFVLALAQAAGDEVYEEYGKDIQTTAAISIMLTTPISMLIVTLSPYLLKLSSPVQPLPSQ